MLTERNLADTTFWGGPQEELATADVYEIQDDSVINNLPLRKLDFASITEEMRGGAAMAIKLPMLTDIKVDSKLTSTLSGLKEKVQGIGGGVLDSVKNLGGVALSALGGVNGLKNLAMAAGPSLLQRVAGNGLNGVPGLSNLGGLTSITGLLGGNLPTSVSSLINAPISNYLGAEVNLAGLTSKLPAGNLPQAFQMGNLLSNFAPSGMSANIVDKDMTSRLIGSLAVGGLSNGITGALNAVLPLAGGDKGIIASAGKMALSYAAGSGNVKGLQAVVNAVGRENLIGMGTTVVSSLASNFTFPWDTAGNPADAMKDSFASVTGAFDALDPKWLKEDIELFDPKLGEKIGYPVLDMSSTMQGSEDFKVMMEVGGRASGDNDLMCFSMANMFDIDPPEVALANNFPEVHTSITANTSMEITELSRPLSQGELDNLFADPPTALNAPPRI